MAKAKKKVTQSKSASKPKPKSSKPAPKKPAKAAAKPAKKPAPVPKKLPAKAAVPAPKAAKVAPSKVEKAVEKKSNAKKLVMAQAYEVFMALWKPKNEGYEAAIDRLIEEYPAPAGQTPEAYRREVTEKVHASMRKEPVTGAIEEQLLERFTKERIHKMASVCAMKPRLSIRLNILKADLNGFAASGTARDLKIKRSTLSPWSFEVGKDEDLYSHPTLNRGLYEIHDEASQFVALLVNARAGQRILDLSANDGNNALALSAMMKNKGSLFIYDADPKRLKNFKERATRAGIDNFRVLSDSQISEVKSLDAVLVEAPSSNLGRLATHPEVKWRFHKDELGKLQKLQAALLREGARKLKLGGYLVYSTSTLNRAENEMQIDHFLKSSHNSYRLVPASQYFREFLVPYVKNFFGFDYDEALLNSIFEYDPFITLMPDEHSTNGTFIAILQRTRIST